MNPDTREILNNAVAGDEKSRELLFSRYGGKLRLYLRARMGRALASKVEIDDLLQETFLRAFRDLHQFNNKPEGGEGDLYLWMLAIARHVLADAGRAARAAKRNTQFTRPLERSDWSRVGGASWGPATKVIFTEESRRIELALDRLSPEHRRVIRMRQFEGRPAREVAELLRSNEMAVHALYRRALSAWAQAAGVADAIGEDKK
ncbi:MAG: RNA polymerase sigma factor [Planctomycetota bacterium]